ncbi:hypothetical protein BZA05DRAFT_442079 [Tricharina praecox]|uniref:uncharacterized protein n=1 Tax=Tricharina praecox TaxID=43433 RepID=UPI00221E88F0|nr:uncharacterized protein BZA05DRAFT_442079 [Tricharina praecox]KAI5856385.1 hypothetical protein BZA05DRAFT_442079 [Tricharina praecox]
MMLKNALLIAGPPLVLLVMAAYGWGKWAAGRYRKALDEIDVEAGGSALAGAAESISMTASVTTLAVSGSSAAVSDIPLVEQVTITGNEGHPEPSADSRMIPPVSHNAAWWNPLHMIRTFPHYSYGSPTLFLIPIPFYFLASALTPLDITHHTGFLTNASTFPQRYSAVGSIFWF